LPPAAVYLASLRPVQQFNNWAELEEYLKVNGLVLKTGSPKLPGDGTPFGPPEEPASIFLGHAVPASDWDTRVRIDDDGLGKAANDIAVSRELLHYMIEQFSDESSAVRRLTTEPITRAFVYLDISDFSKMPTGIQLLVVLALVRIANSIRLDTPNIPAEAQLCIGDGYIYVWKTAGDAARFATRLAQEIEAKSGKDSVPEFHFRIGVHVGLVRCFWDPGRNSWNYVGDGINGGNRVLSAIGKDTDDVVFVSSQVRSALMHCGTIAGNLLPHFQNRGRRADKHGNHWRVYELNHTAVKSI